MLVPSVTHMRVTLRANETLYELQYFASLQTKIASAYSALTRFLTKPSWPLSPSSHRVSSIVSSSVISHCAWLITCCSTSAFFLDACLVRRSAICYRVSIHLISTSTSVARDLTMASSVASRGLLMKERLFPFAVSHQQHRLQRKLCP